MCGAETSAITLGMVSLPAGSWANLQLLILPPSGDLRAGVTICVAIVVARGSRGWLRQGVVARPIPHSCHPRRRPLRLRVSARTRGCCAEGIIPRPTSGLARGRRLLLARGVSVSSGQLGRATSRSRGCLAPCGYVGEGPNTSQAGHAVSLEAPPRGWGGARRSSMALSGKREHYEGRVERKQASRPG